MKLSFWRKTAAVLMAALLALSTPVLALSETLEAAATAEPTAAPAASWGLSSRTPRIRL